MNTRRIFLMCPSPQMTTILTCCPTHVILIFCVQVCLPGPLRTRRPHSRPGTEKGMAVARNEFCWESRDLVFNWSAQLGFSNGAASCTNLPRVRPSVVRVRSWRLVRTRDFRRCVVRVSAAAADRCAQSGDPTRTEQGRSHVAARSSEFYRFTGSKSPTSFI